MFEVYGGQRVWLNSACDWGRSDPLAVPKTARRDAPARTLRRDDRPARLPKSDPLPRAESAVHGALTRLSAHSHLVPLRYARQFHDRRSAALALSPRRSPLLRAGRRKPTSRITPGAQRSRRRPAAPGEAAPPSGDSTPTWETQKHARTYRARHPGAARADRGSQRQLRSRRRA